MPRAFGIELPALLAGGCGGRCWGVLVVVLVSIPNVGSLSRSSIQHLGGSKTRCPEKERIAKPTIFILSGSRHLGQKPSKVAGLGKGISSETLLANSTTLVFLTFVLSPPVSEALTASNRQNIQAASLAKQTRVVLWKRLFEIPAAPQSECPTTDKLEILWSPLGVSRAHSF